MSKLKAYDILDYLNEMAPFETAFEWDNVGFQVGNGKNEIKKVLISLDVSFEAIEEAVENNCDLIISHHPLIFKPLKTVTNETPVGEAVRRLIKNDISVISVHTNLDKAESGVAYCLAKALGLSEVYKLTQDEMSIIHCGEVESDISLEEFAKQIGKNLDTKGIRFSKSTEKVKKIAVGCGAGYGIPSCIIKEGVDTFVVGEAKYNDYLDSSFYGINIVDVGHFASENVVVPVLQKALSKKFANTEFLISKSHTDKMCSML